MISLSTEITCFLDFELKCPVVALKTDVASKFKLFLPVYSCALYGTTIVPVIPTAKLT